jgi:hypothetical protein
MRLSRWKSLRLAIRLPLLPRFIKAARSVFGKIRRNYSSCYLQINSSILILPKKLLKECLPTLVDVRVDRKSEAVHTNILQVDVQWFEVKYGLAELGLGGRSRIRDVKKVSSDRVTCLVELLPE